MKKRRTYNNSNVACDSFFLSFSVAVAVAALTNSTHQLSETHHSRQTRQAAILNVAALLCYLLWNIGKSEPTIA